MKVVDDLTIDLPNPNDVLAMMNQMWRERVRGLFAAIPGLILSTAKNGGRSVIVLYESKLGRDLFDELAPILEREVDSANERYASEIYRVEYDDEGGDVFMQDRTAAISWYMEDD